MNKLMNTAISLVIISITLSMTEQVLATFPGSNGRIAYQSNQTGNTEIYLMDANGNNILQLTNNPAVDKNPAWSPDGTKIAFDSNRSGNFDIYVMNADGTNLQQLTTNPSSDIQPSWSPDGKMIVFRSGRRGSGGSQLWKMSASIGEAGGVTPFQEPFRASSFARFSPDGSRIVITGATVSPTGHAQSAVYIMNADGTNTQQLTAFDVEGYNPDWSSDGKNIVFNDFAISNISNVLITPAPPPGKIITPIEINQAQQITNSGNNFLPRYSPQGDQLVFSNENCTAVPFTCTFNYDIFTTNLSGTPVFNNLTPDETLFNETNADWQPLNYDFGGFQSPISNSSLNLIMAGQAVPMKFSLNGFQGMDIIAQGYPQVIPIACANDAVNGVSQSTVTAGQGGLQYDATSDTYTYVWKTDKSMASGSCYQFVVKLAFAQYYTGYTGATYTPYFFIK